MDDEEHLRVIELTVSEVGGRCPVVAGVSSNDTRHAVKLAERASALRPTALLATNPYYNRPSRRGIVAHFAETVKATDLPLILYNIPSRTAADMDNALLAELGQLDRVEAVKQANHANLARIDGLSIYAGNDDMLADVLDLSEPGGILTATHVLGAEFRRMVEEPERRRDVHDGLHDAFAAMAVAPAACTNKAALRMIGVDAGVPRLPYVELDDSELATVRAMLERHGMLATAA